MHNDIRAYDYYDDSKLISRDIQAKEYFDKKFSNITPSIDLSEITESLDTITTNISNITSEITDIDKNTSDLTEAINEAKSDIIEAVEDSKPCLCNLATKSDVKEAKTEILEKINTTKEEMVSHIDEKFVDLNEQIKS